MKLEYIDIHSQLQFPQFDEDREAIIAKMAEERIATITVGTDFEMSQKAVELAEKHPHLFATIGIHPSAVDRPRARPTDANEVFDEEKFASLITPKVVAAGECGLDYFRGLRDGGQNDPMYKEQQRTLFIQQIEFAMKHNLPLMVHGRPSKGTMDAYEDLLAILKDYPKASGDFHFFVGNIEIARQVIDKGFAVSFDSPVTFTNEYDEVVRFIPGDRILAETDAPFAAPVPHRGKRNEPSFVKHIVARLAEIRGVDEEAFKAALLQNAEHVFPRLQLTC